MTFASSMMMMMIALMIERMLMMMLLVMSMRVMKLLISLMLLLLLLLLLLLAAAAAAGLRGRETPSAAGRPTRARWLEIEAPNFSKWRPGTRGFSASLRLSSKWNIDLWVLPCFSSARW